MREIHQHAQPVHLPHHLLAELGQPVVLGIVGRRIAPLRVLAVGEGHVESPEVVGRPQDRERVLDRVTALHADERGDPARAMDADDVVGGVGDLQVRGIGGHETFDEVDLLDHGAGITGAAAADGNRDVDGPELRAHPALAKPRQIRLHGGIERREVTRELHQVEVERGSLAVLPRRVVVAVDERHLPEQLLCPLRERGIRIIRLGRGRAPPSGHQEHQTHHVHQPHRSASFPRSAVRAADTVPESDNRARRGLNTEGHGGPRRDEEEGFTAETLRRGEKR